MEKLRNLLKASPLQENPEDYYDDRKKIYNTIPVFPFLEEDVIVNVINDVVNEVELKKEITLIHNRSKIDKSEIADTNFIISLVSWNESPQLIKILTIIREWAFRNEGGGVGDFDTDEFDAVEEMKQLMILNPEYEHPIEVIIGGYRYMEHHAESYSKGPMGAHFQFSDKWKNELWIELGRSFINPYFNQRNRKESFDYVLHGLGYIAAKNPQYKGYFGKVTLYKIYELQKADAFFLAVAKKFFRNNKDVWVNPKEKIAEGNLKENQLAVLERDVFKGMFLLLRKEFNINIVPILAVYNRMVDLNQMDYFGAFRHSAFGDTTEVGIAIAFEDIYPIILEKFSVQYK